MSLDEVRRYERTRATTEYIDDVVEVFKGQDDQWYWRRQSQNGEPIAHGEGYTRSGDAAEGALRANPDKGFVNILPRDATA